MRPEEDVFGSATMARGVAGVPLEMRWSPSSRRRTWPAHAQKGAGRRADGPQLYPRNVRRRGLVLGMRGCVGGQKGMRGGVGGQ
jgi:hypothetical protein